MDFHAHEPGEINVLPDRAPAPNIQDWRRGDVDFHADIPERERNTNQSHEAQRRAGDLVARDGPSLTGRSPQEVEREAARIRLGQRFSSFEEFDRCLDSWNVLNGRATHKYTTKAKSVVRVCRFGPVHRKGGYKKKPAAATDPARKPRERNTPSNHNEKSDEAEDDSENSIEPLQPERSPLSAQIDSDQDNSQVHHIYSDQENANSQIHRSRPLPVGTNPLAPRNVNQADGVILSNIESTQVTQPGGRPPRSYIQYTSVWLAPHKPQINGRRISKYGACGEKKRLLPTKNADGSMRGKPKPCPFRVCATMAKKTGVITIKKLVKKHICTQFYHKWRGPTQNAQWLAETLSNRVVTNIKAPVNDLIGGFRMDYKKSTTYYQAWRAKDKVRDSYLGGQRSSFQKIPAVLHEMQNVDPGCVIDWSTERNSQVFKRAFICPSATRHILQYCQPLVSLDACHTKNMKFPTNIFMATALDGNSQVVILCYALAPSETKESWVWFLMMFRRSIADVDNEWIPAISDRGKGLVPALQQVFPGKVTAHYANHLRGNIKDLFGVAASDFFIGMVYAHTKQRFDQLLEKMRTALSAGEEAAKYIRELDPKDYARHAFPLPRLGKVCSNPAEQANSGLLSIRQYAPCKIIVEMWFYMQAKHKDRKNAAAEWDNELSEVALRRYTKNKSTFGQWQVHDDGSEKCKVQTVDMKEEYLIQLDPTPTCSCWELQEMIWPCQHIMAWDDTCGRDSVRHFHACWMAKSVQAMYQAPIPPFLCEDLPASTGCLPPEVAKTKGRHRYVRLKKGGGKHKSKRISEDEYIDQNGDLLRRFGIADNPHKIVPMPSSASPSGTSPSDGPVAPSQQQGRSKNAKRCRKCGQLGHNRRTCGRVPANTQEEVCNLGEIDDSDVALEGTTLVLSDENSEEEEAEELQGEEREIFGVRFGDTQNPQHPEWAPWCSFNEMNLAGISQVQENLQNGLRAPVEVNKDGGDPAAILEDNAWWD